MKPLTPHQLSVLRDYEQLGTIAAVADFRGVSAGYVYKVLRRCRLKLNVATTDEAVLVAQEQADG